MAKPVKQLTVQALLRETLCSEVGFWQLCVKQERKKRLFIVAYDDRHKSYILAKGRSLSVLGKRRTLEDIVNVFNEYVPENAEVVVR